MKNKKRRRTRGIDWHLIWKRGKTRAKRKYMSTWSDGECNVFAYGYEDGFRAAMRSLRKDSPC